jgi:hypothetical protein
MKKAIVITCAEPRHHVPEVRLFEDVLEKLRNDYGVEMAYKIALAGADGILSRGHDAHKKTMIDQVELLISAGSPVAIAVIGHEDCAGNPVSNEEHCADIQCSCNVLTGVCKEIPVIGFFAKRTDDRTWHLDSVI